MDIQHTAKDFELTAAIREYAEEKLRKACTQLEAFQGVHMHVTYETVGHANHGENRGLHVVCFVPKGEPLKAEEVDESLYAAIDAASKDIERQVNRYREKHSDRRRA